VPFVVVRAGVATWVKKMHCVFVFRIYILILNLQ